MEKKINHHKLSLQINSETTTKKFNKIKPTLEIFYQICQIPHPSGKTKDLQKFIVDFLRHCDCKIQTDSAGNIHALKGSPNIIFQAHYDMVLVGEKIVPFVKNGFLKSRNSSLGADNGVAVALLLDFARQCKNFEILLTNDEEIGMLGAKNLSFQTQSKTMINLDSECLNEICVGCAGGFDADISLKDFWNDFDKDFLKGTEIYELRAQNFSGGHSGIDIDKNIRNAIVELLWKLEFLRKKSEFSILEISGGENRNSIPINAKAVIAIPAHHCENYKIILSNPQIVDKLAKSTPFIAVKKLKSYTINPTLKLLNSAIISYLLRLHNGIYETDAYCVTSSLNFSLLNYEFLKVMVRANSAEFLQRHKVRLKNIFGDNVILSGFYNAWEDSSNKSAILAKLQKIYKKYKIKYKMVQIHAGLECGILKEKCALNEVVSIGPNILHPHSKNEVLDLASLEKIYDILKDLMQISKMGK